MIWKKNVKIISTKGLTADMINKYSILNGAKYFSLNELQNYLVFQIFISHISTKNDKIYLGKSKGMSEESITPPCTTSKSFYPELIGLYDGELRIKPKGICLKKQCVFS